MATQLTSKSKISDDSVFLLDTDVAEGFTYTEDQYDDAVAFYRAKISKTDKGRVPLNKAFNEWHKAGMPKINSDEIKRERLAVSEGAGKPWTELTAEQYEAYRQNWEDAGSPEPVEFLPRNARAKLIGRVLEAGKETEDEQVIYIPGKLLDKYREDNGLTGPSGFETYLGASEELWKGKIAPHTLRTTSRTIKLVNGKMVTKSEAFKSELKSMLAEAIANRDFEALAKLQERLADA
jgi:hypothetical protein